MVLLIPDMVSDSVQYTRALSWCTLMKNKADALTEDCCWQINQQLLAYIYSHNRIDVQMSTCQDPMRIDILKVVKRKIKMEKLY